MEIGTFRGFVDRGDPAAYDFNKDTLTKDDAWHDLDLSGIVPTNAKAVQITFVALSATAGLLSWLRKKGNTNTVNTLAFSTYSGDIWGLGEGIVKLSSDRKIQYKISSGTYVVLFLTVRGWFI